MVSSTAETNNQNEIVNNGEEIKSVPLPMPVGIGPGRYKLISWDLDTSGRRLIDEICQIAAYTPESDFSQYVMPFSDLNLQARRRHSIRIVTIGRYRMLKDARTNKFLKTKSDLYALTDFVTWLEETNEKAKSQGYKDGVILVLHEPRKGVPLMLLEALRRLNLLDRFTNIVKGFANSFQIAEQKCQNQTLKFYSLKALGRVLLNKQRIYLSSAAERARLTYEILQKLANPDEEENKEGGDDEQAKNRKYIDMIELVRPFTQPLEYELNDLLELKKLLEYQNTFRPIFGAFLRSSKTERQHASHLRRLLAENNITFEKLESGWKEGTREALLAFLQKELQNVNEEDLNELVDILDCYFDPEKKPKQPKFNPRRRRGIMMMMNRGRFYRRNNFRRRNPGEKKDKKSQDDGTSKGEDSLSSDGTGATNSSGADGASPVSSSDNTPRQQAMN